MKTLVKTRRPEKDSVEVVEKPEIELPEEFIWSLLKGMKEDKLDVMLLGDTSGS